MIENCPKISVITVCYNAVNEIEQTILSVIDQTYTNLEYIIVDGGSEDGTIDIIKKHEANIDKWLSEPDKGIYDAMNKGVRMASGEWVNFMNAGDCFYQSDVIETIFSSKTKFDIFVLFGDVALRDKAGCSEVIKANSVDFLKKGMPFNHQTAFVNRTSIVPFDTKYKICSDYNFFYNLYWTKGRDCFDYIGTIIASCENSNGVSVVNQKQHRKENLMIRSSHKDMRWVWDYLKYFIKFQILQLT